MNKVEVYIIVEGQTEQTFIRELLGPMLSYNGVYLHPALIGKPVHKGGNIRFDRAKIDIGNFLKQRPDIIIYPKAFDFRNIAASYSFEPVISCSNLQLAICKLPTANCKLL